MYARTTLFEVDVVRMELGRAEQFFREEVLPELRGQPGFAGVVLMHTPDGKGQLITFWDTEDAAKAGLASGFYQEQVAKFLTVMRQPPGREQYEVTLVEGVPALTGGR